MKYNYGIDSGMVCTDSGMACPVAFDAGMSFAYIFITKRRLHHNG